MKTDVANRLIWYKGEIMNVNDAKINILAPTSQFGLNVFEGIPCYWNDDEKQLYAFRLDAHYDRLLRSARLIQINCPYTKEEMKKALLDVVNANEYDENLSVRQFEQPDSVETAYVCKKSGLLAVDGVCTGDPRGSMAYTEYFAKGTTPTKSCDVHTAVKVCSSTGLLPTATCTTTTKIFVKRPAGSEGTTEDSAYAPPSATCKGHNILDKITDILNPKKDAADMDADDSKKDGATTPGSDANSGSTTTPDGNSGSGDSSGSGGTGSGTGSGSGGSTSGGGSGGDSGGTTAPGGDDILEIIP